MKNILLLGSKSASRRMLLEQSHIPFQLVEQDADETKCDWGLSLQKVVESIALYKMDHLILPEGAKNADMCFVLTGDTLSENSQGDIEGKPASREDAVEKLKNARKGMRTGTAFCLERKIWREGSWATEKQIVKYVEAQYEFNVPDQWINTYFEKSVGFQAAGAIAVEEFGAQFFKIVSGSYTAIVGMPMYELREALEELNFFDFSLMSWK